MPLTHGGDMPVTRRTVLRGAAAVWAVPVIALAAPVPASAASLPEAAACDNGGLTVELIRGQPAEAIQITNLTSGPVVVTGTADSGSAHLDDVCNADSFQETAPGGGVFSVGIPFGGSVVLSLLVFNIARPGPTGFITIPGCGRYSVTSVEECPVG
jgi:hypothetical protein